MLVFHRAIPCGDFTVDNELVPCRRMTHVIDRHVVVLAPEERNLGKPLPLAEHVARRRLALALGDHLVLDPEILAGAGDFDGPR